MALYFYCKSKAKLREAKDMLNQLRWNSQYDCIFHLDRNTIVTFSDFPDEEGFYRHQISWDEIDPLNPMVRLPIDCGKVPPVFKELARILNPEIIKNSRAEKVDLTQIIACPLSH